jgi:hypothetical protein
MLFARVTLLALFLILNYVIAHSTSKHNGNRSSHRQSTDGESQQFHGFNIVQTPVASFSEPGRIYNRTLLPLKFQPFALGAIKPRGWQKDQLELMAQGLPGHMHEFYRLVKDATWMGGNAEYSALNEAYSYYYDGVVPLAYLLDDARLISHVWKSTNYLLDHQHQDGWLGPENDPKRRNFWGRYPLFLGLMQLAEADEAYEKSILRSMHQFVDLMHSMLQDGYQGYVRKPGDLFDEQWGRSRAADMIIVLQWLYQHHAYENSDKLHECIVRMYEMAYDWSWYFSEENYLQDDLESHPNDLLDSLFPFLHVVNAAQGLKSPAVMRRLTHEPILANKSRTGVEWTYRYHGTPSGAIYGDERQGSKKPFRGTELCSVVESLFSLNYLYQALGDRTFADRAEAAAFNALPAMILPDWWAHQYVAQTNQPASHKLRRPPFWNVRESGQTFGLEPNYPCCAVRFSTGLPKYIAASFLKADDDHFVHALLGPGELRASIAGSKQHPHHDEVLIQCTTNYPFNHFLNYTIRTAHPLRFSVRVPEWSLPETSVYQINNSTTQPLSPSNNTGLHTFTFPAGTHNLAVWFDAKVRIESHTDRTTNTTTITLHHGALLYALPVSPATYTSHRPQNYNSPTDAPPQSADWTIEPSANTTWNLAVDPSTARFYGYPAQYADELPNPIWAMGAPPVSITVLACPVDWGLTEGGWADEPPGGETHWRERCTGRARVVELKPYGSCHVRVAQFPLVDFGTR